MPKKGKMVASHKRGDAKRLTKSYRPSRKKTMQRVEGYEPMEKVPPKEMPQYTPKQRILMHFTKKGVKREPINKNPKDNDRFM